MRDEHSNQRSSMSIDRQAHPDGASFSLSTSVQGPGRTIYVSGVLGPGTTLAEQTNACFDEIEKVLGAQGATLEDIVRITTYLTGLDEYSEFSRVRAERFAGALPASTAVQVAGLLMDALIEIDAVAFLAA
jgi:enamine deaminase RidA (YjgF/YER057c/UK114 family)